MIPTIEQIVEDLAAGAITKAQAVTWIEQHVASKLNENRIMFSTFALQGVVSGSKGLNITTDQFAKAAVDLADALVKELSK